MVVQSRRRGPKRWENNREQANVNYGRKRGERRTDKAASDGVADDREIIMEGRDGDHLENLANVGIKKGNDKGKGVAVEEDLTGNKEGSDGSRFDILGRGIEENFIEQEESGGSRVFGAQRRANHYEGHENRHKKGGKFGKMTQINSGFNSGLKINTVDQPKINKGQTFPIFGNQIMPGPMESSVAPFNPHAGHTSDMEADKVGGEQAAPPVNDDGCSAPAPNTAPTVGISTDGDSGITSSMAVDEVPKK